MRGEECVRNEREGRKDERREEEDMKEEGEVRG